MIIYDVCYNPMDRVLYVYKDTFDFLYNRKWMIETLGM
jgi:hypothetical protein